MPILAYSSVQLHNIASILHDLWLPLPGKDLNVEGGRLVLTITDMRRELRKDAISEYRLTINDVCEVEVKGNPNPSDYPDPCIFNTFKYKSNESSLIVDLMRPLCIVCKVKRLHVVLEQLV